MKQFSNLAIYQCSNVRGFTFIEIMVALAVFALVIAGAAGIFISIQQAWQRQRAIIDLVQNATWATEFMSNEVRGAGNVSVVSGDRLRFELPPGGVANRVWYWRGDGVVFGDRDKIYRGVGSGINQANGNRKELVNLIIDNPTGNNIFTNTGNLYTIELTLQRDNHSYTLRTKVRPRN